MCVMSVPCTFFSLVMSVPCTQNMFTVQVYTKPDKITHFKSRFLKGCLNYQSKQLIKFLELIYKYLTWAASENSSKCLFFYYLFFSVQFRSSFCNGMHKGIVWAMWMFLVYEGNGRVQNLWNENVTGMQEALSSMRFLSL